MAQRSDPETFTLQEMSDWLSQEIADVDKARDLRVRQATAFVEMYSRGECSPKEATDALFEYDVRWGDALFGVHTSPDASDQELLKAVDKKRSQGSHAEKASASRSSNVKPVLY